MLTSMLRLGLETLAARWKVTLLMVIIIALPLTGYLVLEAYRAGLAHQFPEVGSDLLVVQSSGSMGEFYGSRLPADLSTELKNRGAGLVIPEIHTVTGTSPDNAILLRGVPLESYAQIEEFRMLAGRPLLTGDAPRLTMIGVKLAERRKVNAGDYLEIRGRRFQVIGVFSTQTYADYEAWVSLPDAQILLGWGTDVSVYVIRANQGLRAGEQLSFGASIVPQGTSNGEIVKEWKSFLDFIATITYTLGLAAMVALSNLLWRLVWMHRHELAILRSLGFGQGAMSFYLVAQSGVITLLGYILGSLGAFLIGALTETRAAGISTQAYFSPQVLAASLLFAILIALAGSSVPVWQISQSNLTALLRDE
jgi:ABC-type lipoprotein release transport system permease subunit